MQNTYDYIIAGTGCAGFSLALKMSQEDFFSDKRILLIEREAKLENDRTWCFWAENALGYDEIMRKSWRQIIVRDDEKIFRLPLKNMQYYMLRGSDFYAYCREKISEKNNFTLIKQNIVEIKEDEVRTKTGEIFSAKVIFDSTTLPDLAPRRPDYLFLYQHFKGWFIRTETPTFDANAITMFDFRCEQGDDMRFFYILPLSATEALVEYTIFGDTLFAPEDYDLALQNYCKTHFSSVNFTITETEEGIIPMTNFHFDRKKGKSIFRIGTAGGMCKASTGYAFFLIQKDCDKIIHALKSGIFPHDESFFSKRFWLYDSMLLNIFAKRKLAQAPLFMRLFERNPTERLLRFLINETNFAEELSIMASVPPLPFLASVPEVLNMRKK